MLTGTFCCFRCPRSSSRGVSFCFHFDVIQDGLLCTWRRKPLQMSSQPEPLPLPSFTNEISKELWLFWYSNDPPEKLSINTSHLGIHFLSCYFRILLLAMLPFLVGIRVTIICYQTVPVFFINSVKWLYPKQIIEPFQ